MTGVAGHVKGASQLWTVPDEARKFILDRVDKRQPAVVSARDG
jgi:hypothetical protein